MKNKQGQLYQLDDSGRIRAEYTNTSTGEHHCMPFASEEGATAWLTSKGVSYKDIEMVTEGDDRPTDMPDIGAILKEAVGGLDHRLNALAKLKGLNPKTPYTPDDMTGFEKDAITNMVILAKCGVPVQPEDLEDYLQSHLAGRGVKS